MTEILQFLFSGVMVGAVYALIAVGFCIVYNATDAINFAQGEFSMLGGMVAAVVFRQTEMHLLLVVITAIAIATAVGIACERLTIAPLRRPSAFNIIIITFGVSIVLKAIVMMIWGKFALNLPAFSGEKPVGVAGATLHPQALWILAATLVTMVAVHLFFARTLTGKAMQAAAKDREVAAMVGINVKAMVMWSFFLASAIGAVAGIVITPITLTSYDHGTLLGLKGLCAAILGGLGNIYGAFFGGLLLGVLESFAAGMISSGYRDAIAFFVLIVILLVRPRGILGERAVKRV